METFKELLKGEENGRKDGFKNGVWFPHKSPEGGTRTIAYGHKLSQEEEDGDYVVLPNGKIVDFSKRGLPEAEAEMLFDADVQKKRSLAATQWDAAQKTPFSSLKPLHQTLLTEIAFNSKGGLKNSKGNFGWPKLAKGILADDTEAVKKEIERTFVDSKGVRRPLEKRVNRIKAFIDAYEADPKPSLLVGFVPDTPSDGTEQPVDEPQMAYSKVLNDLTNQLNNLATPPSQRSQGRSQRLGQNTVIKSEDPIDELTKLIDEDMADADVISRGERRLAKTYKEVKEEEERNFTEEDERKIQELMSMDDRVVLRETTNPAPETEAKPEKRDADPSKDPTYGLF